MQHMQQVQAGVPCFPDDPPPLSPPETVCCRPDAQGVMQYMQQVQAAGLDSDDPLSSYMLQAGARICKTLGQDFLPYLQVGGIVY